MKNFFKRFLGIDKLEEEIKALSEQNVDLENQVKTLKEQDAKLFEDSNELKNQVKVLEEQNTKLSESSHELKAKVKTLKEQNTKLLEDSNELKKQVKVLEEQNTKLSESSHELKARVKILSEQNTKLLEDSNELKKQVKVLKKQNTKLLENSNGSKEQVKILKKSNIKLPDEDSKSTAEPSEIESFELKSNENTSVSLKFNKTLESIDFSKQWEKPISLDKSVGNIMSNLTGLGTQVELAYEATKGLFKTDANPDTLMKLSKGGVGGAIVDPNTKKITGQASFNEVGVEIFTPNAIFQTLAAITGQYYLHGITKQLNGIQKKVEKLIKIFEYEKIAKLKVSFDKLGELSQRKSFEVEDFTLLQNLRYDLRRIEEEDSLSLEDEKDHLKSLMDQSVSGETLVNKFKERYIFPDLDVLLSVAHLRAMSDIVELHMNISLKKPSANRLNKTQEVLEKITQFDIHNLYTNINKYSEDILEDLLNYLKHRRNKGGGFWGIDNETINSLVNTCKGMFSDFRDKKNKMDEGLKLQFSQIIKALSSEREIVLDTRKDTPILYIKGK